MTRRFWLGAAIAPFTAAAMYETLILLDPTSGKVFSANELVMGFSFGLLPASYLLCIVFGAPLVSLLQRRNILNSPILVGSAGALTASSVGLALSVAFIFSGANSDQFMWKSFFLLLGGSGLFGALVAGVFCIVAGVAWRSTECAGAPARRR